MRINARPSIVIAAATLVSSLILGACGSSSSDSAEPSSDTEPASVESSSPDSAEPSSAGTSSAGTGSDAGSGSIVVFMPPSSIPYAASYQEGATAEAERLGWEISFITNNFDQAQQNSQVQQYISSGEKPSVFVWWPSDAKGGLVALNQLAETGVPIIMSNQIPSAEEKPLIKAYAGVDDAQLGRNVGEYAVQALEAMREDGRELSSEFGNAIVIAGPPGYPASVLRTDELTKVLDEAGVNIVGVTDQTTFDSATGYEFSLPLITRAKTEGIDVVVQITDFTTPGVIRALEQNDLTPGEDVEIVSATCSSNSIAQLEEGTELLTGIQPPKTEGKLAVEIAVKVANGEQVSFDNFMPTATITIDNITTYELNGESVQELCEQS